MAETSGKVALITGASAGIGLELARLFAKDGDDLVLVARRQDRLDELKAELEAEHGIRAHVVAADLADPAAPERIATATAERGLTVDYLVNNAGFGSTGAFTELAIERELAMVQVNISALMHLCHLYIPNMVQRKSGRILNMGSTAGFQGGPFMATYYASKAFVNHFSEALWMELKGTGVTVTVHCPGPVRTEFSDIAGNDRSKLFGGAVSSAADVALDAYRAMHRGRRMAVHGFKYKMMLQSQRLSSRGMVLGMVASLNRPSGDTGE